MLTFSSFYLCLSLKHKTNKKRDNWMTAIYVVIFIFLHLDPKISKLRDTLDWFAFSFFISLRCFCFVHSFAHLDFRDKWMRDIFHLLQNAKCMSSNYDWMDHLTRLNQLIYCIADAVWKFYFAISIVHVDLMSTLSQHFNEDEIILTYKRTDWIATSCLMRWHSDHIKEIMERNFTSLSRINAAQTHW